MHARSAVALAFALLAGCQGKQAAPSAAPRQVAEPVAEAQADATPAPNATSAPGIGATRVQHDLLALTLSDGEAAVHHFTIPLVGTKIAFIDLKYQTPLVEALGEHDLVLNGGYWGYRDQQRVIEGLLVVNDQLFSPAHKHGGVLEVRDGMAHVVRGEAFTPAPHTALALQCHPRLVDAGKMIPKLESRRRAARTALCIMAERSQLHAYLTESPITLPELALFLLQQGCLEALNLDGGPSTAAVSRLPDGVLRVARGEALPYGVGFTLR